MDRELIDLVGSTFARRDRASRLLAAVSRDVFVGKPFKMYPVEFQRWEAGGSEACRRLERLSGRTSDG